MNTKDKVVAYGVTIGFFVDVAVIVLKYLQNINIFSFPVAMQYILNVFGIIAFIGMVIGLVMDVVSIELNGKANLPDEDKKLNRGRFTRMFFINLLAILVIFMLFYLLW